MAEVQFSADVVADLEELDGSALRLVLRKLRILETDPEAGQPLGSRQTSNLTGFRKLVIGNRAYRAVYRIESNGQICVIWVIAGRVDDECYELAIERLERHGQNQPEIMELADMIAALRPRKAAQVRKARPDWAAQQDQ